MSIHAGAKTDAFTVVRRDEPFYLFIGVLLYIMFYGYNYKRCYNFLRKIRHINSTCQRAYHMLVSIQMYLGNEVLVYFRLSFYMHFNV